MNNWANSWLNRWTNSLCFVCLIGLGQASCTSSERTLPILGESHIEPHPTQGTDTVYHQIADFRFLNQDSVWVSQQTFAGKIYVADFFFASCPTICPMLAQQMLRVYEAYEEHPSVLLLSHTVDPERDSVAVLKDYAERLELGSDKWHFVTGKKEDLHTLATDSYLSVTYEDGEEPGGFVHTGHLLLVDSKRRIRGFYDGTAPEKVDVLLEDIKHLLREEGL